MAKHRLAQVELEIMEGVWAKGKPVSVRDLLDALYPNGEKAYTTVQTILNILVEKGALAKEKVGLVNFYRPVVSRKDAVVGETASFVSRLFNGSFGELATYLVDSGELSDDELAALRSAIDRRRKEDAQ